MFEDRKKDLEASYLLARPSKLPPGLADGLGRKAPYWLHWGAAAKFAPKLGPPLRLKAH